MQLYIRRCFMICMCKFLVQNVIIKDVLKKKNVVHWISVRTTINVKIPTTVGILTFMSRNNFVLSWVEHENSFKSSGPGRTVLLFASFIYEAFMLVWVEHEKSFITSGARSSKDTTQSVYPHSSIHPQTKVLKSLEQRDYYKLVKIN